MTARRTAKHPFIRSVTFTPTLGAPDTIRDATKARCIEEQEEARTSAFFAMQCMEFGWIIRAGKEQRVAAHHSDQAWMRLARLIGVE